MIGFNWIESWPVFEKKIGCMIFDLVSAVSDRAEYILNQVSFETQKTLEKLREER